MSSSSIQILHRDRIPATGVLVIPSRLNFEQLLLLEKLFNGRKITWLVEETSQHDPALRSYLEKSGSGAMFSATDAAPASAGEQLKPYLSGDGVLIYVPGRSAARNATACRIPASHLQAMCAFGLPLLAHRHRLSARILPLDRASPVAPACGLLLCQAHRRGESRRGGLSAGAVGSGRRGLPDPQPI